MSQLFTQNAVDGNFRDQTDGNSGADYKRQKRQILKLNKNNACTGHNVALSKDAKSEPFLGIIEACNILLQFVSHF